MQKTIKRIGIADETKVPEDNRVLFSPELAAKIRERYPHVEVVVEHSSKRAFLDEEYIARGIPVVSDLSSCDAIFGIKEMAPERLLRDKHYFFFGHIAKKQVYNQGLLWAMIDKGITFTDYEYLTSSEGYRVCAFGFYAGIVGAYNALRGYGLRTKGYPLSEPNGKMLESLKHEVAAIPKEKLPRVLVTGDGRVGKGSMLVLDQAYKRLPLKEFLSTKEQGVYAVAAIGDMLYRIDGGAFEEALFFKDPQKFGTKVPELLRNVDVYISTHFWGANDPVHLTQEALQGLSGKLKLIADVTCDIRGGVASTIRPSTHTEPFYDYDAYSDTEREAFSSEKHITVMAVDTLPNALPRDASEHFGEAFFEHVLPCLLSNESYCDDIVARGTIVEKGELTPSFSYLSDFAKH